MGIDNSSKIVVRQFLICIFPLIFAACTSPTSNQSSSTSIESSVPLTETSTPIATFIPMLYHEDADALYRLLYPEGCALPCLWGITPGESTKQDVEGVLTQLGSFRHLYFPLTETSTPSSQFRPTATATTIEIGYASLDFKFENEVIQMNIDFTFSLDDGRFETMHGNTRSMLLFSDARGGQFDSTFYEYLFRGLSMSDIIAKYGSPPQIVMSLENNTAEPNSPDFFKTWFLYPEHGTIISYEATAQVRPGQDNHYGSDDDFAYVCPVDSFVELWILKDNSQQAFDSKLSEITYYWTDSTSVPEQYKSVNEAMGISIAEFSAAVMEGENTCFETPVEIWPMLY